MRFSTLLLAAACAAPLATAQNGQTYVANQGGFGANTSSLTSLSLLGQESDQLFEGQFGSSIQSIERIGDRLYVMSDEAGRIDVIDTDTNQRVAQITSPDVTTVRYMAEVSPGKAYVTQLYLPDGSFSGGSVAVVDLATNQFNQVINDESFSNPEGIAVVGQKAFVANSGFGSATTLTVLDTEADAVTGTVELGCSARAVLSDEADGEVYAFCQDEVVVVTAATGTVAARIAAPDEVRPLGTGGLGEDAAQRSPSFVEDSFLVMAAVGTGGVLTLDPSTNEVSVVPIAGERSISSIGVGTYYGGDFVLDILVLGRPDVENPFSAAGIVTTHALFDGSLQSSVAAGVYPTSVATSNVIKTSGEPSAEADAFALTSVYPNPAAGRATAAFTLAQAQTVRVRVFDVLGREVLADERAFAAGAQQVDLDAAALRPGLYVVRLEAGTQTATARFTVAR